MKTTLPIEFLQPMRVAIVGCGGIGCFLARPLVRFLEYCPLLEDIEIDVYLIDHDVTTASNLERQSTRNGVGRNKAIHLASTIEEELSLHRVRVTGLPVAMTPKQGMKVFKDTFWGNGIIVASCVDSHKSRVYIQETMAHLNSGILVCGGNGLHDGQVQIWAKDGGEETAQIHHAHPEMNSAPGRFPDEPSCSNGAVVNPQLIWANMACAAIMGTVFWRFVKDGLSPFFHAESENEVHFDLSECSMKSIRNPSLIRKGTCS